jgi:glycosyltransferase involved in cell wall biosynthesis
VPATETVSIVVNNYNYGEFLSEAIDSALAQTYSPVEVVVVDDGSTDDSADVIAGYGDAITTRFQPNAGQASALNAGFAISRGEIVCFLDADDKLVPTAASEFVPLFRDHSVVNVHWPLWQIDKQGRRSGRLVPSAELSDGDDHAAIIQRGPMVHVYAPTSGNAWSRRFLETVLPVPNRYRISADLYLCTLSPLHGLIRRLTRPLGMYRTHGANAFWRPSLRSKLAMRDRTNQDRYRITIECLRSQGVAVNPEDWFEVRDFRLYLDQLRPSLDELDALITSATFILVDQDEWWGEHLLEGRTNRPFLDRQGTYWGPPPDSQTAIAELERMRGEAAGFIVFAWPAFWWLDHYSEFARYLRERFECVLENERLIVFDLRDQS